MVLRLGRIEDYVGGSNGRGGLQVGASGVGRIGDDCRRGRDIWGSVRWGGWDGGKVEPKVDVVNSEASGCLEEKSFCVLK